MSKHGGGGRYTCNFRVEGEQIKKKKKERKKKKMRKEKSMSMYDIEIK
jgi:hypothetical protein